jgi:hypothetical protein
MREALHAIATQEGIKRQGLVLRAPQDRCDRA